MKERSENEPRERDPLEWAGAVSDHASVDWERLREDAEDPDERALIANLEIISRVYRASGGGGQADDLPFARWGSLRLLSRVGEGGSAEVFRAWDESLDREVALKLLRAPAGRPARADLELQLEEARRLARVHDNNVVQVYGAEVHEGRAGFWMELVVGRTLADWIEVQGTVDVPTASLAGITLAKALAAVHAAGLAHGDVKPANVMREAGGRLVLMDLGAGRAIESADEVDDLHATPLYAAPEVLAEQAPRVASDVYSLGVLLYHLVTGRHPVEGRTIEELRAAHREGRVVSVRTRLPGVDEGFARLLDTMLASDPEDRPDLVEVEAALHARLTGDGAARGRRRRVISVLGVAAVVLALVFGPRLFTPEPADEGTVAAVADASGSPTLALQPFLTVGGVAGGVTGEQVAAMLRPRLEAPAGWHCAHEDSTVGRVDEVLTGRLLPDGDGLRLEASLLAPDRSLRGSVSLSGTAGELPELLDRLAVRLLSEHGPVSTSRFAGAAARTAPDLATLRAFLAGEWYRERGDDDAAFESLREAVRRDSTLAVAQYRLSMVTEVIGAGSHGDLMLRSAQIAERHADDLAPRLQALIHALAAWRRGEMTRAARIYQQVLDADPGDTESWLQLGEIQLHAMPRFGASTSSAKAAWRAVVRDRPTDRSALTHLGRILVAEGDRGESARVLAELERLTPPGEVFTMSVLHPIAFGTAEERAAAIARARTAPPSSIMSGVWEILAHTRDLPAALELSEELVRAGRSDETRAFGHAVRAHLWLADGRWSRVLDELDRMRLASPRVALEFEGHVLSLAIVPVDTLRLRVARERLLAWDAVAAEPSEAFNNRFTVHNRILPALRPYLLGRIAAKRGDADACRDWADSLAAWRPDRPDPAARRLGAELALGLRARAAWIDGDVEEAARLLDACTLDAPYQKSIWSPVWSQVDERWWRAVVSEERGAFADALRWYDSFDQVSAYDFAFEAAGRRARARIFAREGQARTSAREYARADSLWADADAALLAVSP